jgi:hypothetical protein
MIPIGKKLFEEVDMPKRSEIINENREKGTVESESSWTGQIKGIDLFPNGRVEGKGNSLLYSNGISISNWQGTFTTEEGKEISFIGKDTNKLGKYFVLRTFFTDTHEHTWINGLVCILDGSFDHENKTFRCNGYELM